MLSFVHQADLMWLYARYNSVSNNQFTVLLIFIHVRRDIGLHEEFPWNAG